MSSRTLQSAPLEGQALVKLRNGTEYEGHAIYDGKLVTIDGRLRVLSAGRATHRPRRVRSLQPHLVREIVWSERASQVAAAGR